MKALVASGSSSLFGRTRSALHTGSSRRFSVVSLPGGERRRRATALGNGFTLLEVLLVMTLIVILVGAIGMALAQRGGGGVALRSAAETLAASVARARQQAILHQTKTRWLLSASKPPLGRTEDYLCAVQIICEDPASSGSWVAVENGVVLPRGVAVVPPVVEADQLVPNVSWPGGSNAPHSHLNGPIAVNIDGVSFSAAYYLEFGPNGQSDPTPTIVCVASTRSGSDGVMRFEGPESIRGFRLQASGAIIHLDDAAQF